VSVAGQGCVNFGEVFVGITGKTTFVVHLVSLITGTKCADSDVSYKTIFNFMYDMCRTQTKDAQAFVKDRSFDWAVELEKKDLQKRVCQIFAAQIGVRADGNNSLVQRMSQFMKDNGIKSMPLKNLKVFNTNKIRQQVDIKWTMESVAFDAHEMDFPMGGELERCQGQTGDDLMEQRLKKQKEAKQKQEANEEAKQEIECLEVALKNKEIEKDQIVKRKREFDTKKKEIDMKQKENDMNRKEIDMEMEKIDTKERVIVQEIESEQKVLKVKKAFLQNLLKE